jgi:hypothetical protein
MIGRMILFGSVIVSASAPTEVPPQSGPRFRLECQGTMTGAAEKVPPVPVVVGGMVDLEKRHVRGFGLSIEPIRFANSARIEFGSGEKMQGPIVEGTIDRATFHTEIRFTAIGGMGDPPTVMRLDCRPKPSLY